MMRVGYGYDFHNFAEGKELILGGVKIPYFRGLEGHSDADVLIHAICDALLGAIGEEDIGEHFPEADDRYRDISSIEIAKEVLKIVDNKGYKIINIDTMILAEEPKLSPFKRSIKESLLKIFNLKGDQLSLKATTTEGKDAIGSKESIAAVAVTLVDGK